MNDNLSGVICITPTPFNHDGSLDLDGITTLVGFYKDAGVHGLTILGVMGESNKLLPDERARVTEAYLEAAGGQLPVIVGATHAGTNVAIALAQKAASQGAVGVMIAPPPVSGGSADKLVFEHFKAISDAISIPIILQDFPPASAGLKLSPELLAEMGKNIPRVQYLKLEDPPTPKKIAQVRQLAGDSLGIFGALGGLFYFEELEQGSLGTLTGFAFPEFLVEIYNAHSAGNVDGAAELFYRYLPLIRFESQPGIELAIRKEIFLRRGLIKTSTARAPANSLDEYSSCELTNLMARLGLD